MSTDHYVEVHYSIRLDEKQFKKAREIAEEHGHGFDDAGPVETIRRMLISDGVDSSLEEVDFGIVNVTRLTLAYPTTDAANWDRLPS